MIPPCASDSLRIFDDCHHTPPYGRVYYPAQPYDGIERGLLGYFINSNIEFVLGEWVNKGRVRRLCPANFPSRKTQWIATQDPEQSIFVIPQPNGSPAIKVGPPHDRSRRNTMEVRMHPACESP
jgi:hypothetical protein